MADISVRMDPVTGGQALSVTIKKVGKPYNNLLQYRIGTTGGWTDVQFGVAITATNKDIYFRGSGQLSKSDKDYYQFVTNSLFYLKGDLMALLNYDGSCKVAHDFCFYNLFKGTHVSFDRSSLAAKFTISATTFGRYSCMNLFANCTGITNLPDNRILENDITLGNYCFKRMFYNCVNMNQVPHLTATILPEGCYEEMFYNCKTLYLKESQTTSSWKIPHGALKTFEPFITAGTTDYTYAQHNMFKGCKGFRHSGDTLYPEVGKSIIFTFK